MTSIATAPHPATEPLRLAIRYEPDGFNVKAERLMGRQAAGNGFLRAAIEAARDGILGCVTPSNTSFQSFHAAVSEMSPTTRSQWVPTQAMGPLREFGTLYCPDANIHAFAGPRLRSGVDQWSIMGVTHTTASSGAVELIGGLLTAPVMPWDALICTSLSVLKTVETILGEAREHLAWRLGTQPKGWRPQLPVIPLGIHTEDFAFAPQETVAARAALGIAEDEIVALFVGRLSFHAKAHPHAMYRALETVARRTGRKIVLLQCGWFANDFIENAFREGASRFAPSVRHLFVDGREAEGRQRSWASGDLFISLSDNIQETFGLVPLEAMAAGMPVIVTDWDGYRELVRHEIDGFRVPTIAPVAGLNHDIATRFETGAINYDQYCALTSQAVAVDHERLAFYCETLVRDAALRTRMGEAGRAHVRGLYDWRHVLARYRELMDELAAIRATAKTDPAFAAMVKGTPRHDWHWPDPFHAFAHYPTRVLGPDTPIAPGDPAINLDECLQHPLFVVQGRERILALAARLGPAETSSTPARLAAETGLPLALVVLILAQLAKIGAIRVLDGVDAPSDLV
jgi:starch synthase